MLRLCVLTVVCLFTFHSNADAIGRRRVQTYNHQQSQVIRTTPKGTTTVTRESITGNSPMAEVNSARLARGLRPFIEDPNLTIAATKAASMRANSLIAGHLSNDFACLPAGCSASAAGCGALSPSWGWGTCCTYDNYTYAGASFAWGRDGKRYMHIFVR